MDSRMNVGNGFSVPQENEFPFMGSWMPVTPEKPMPRRPNLVPVNRDTSQLGRMHEQELAGFPISLVDGMLNNGRVENHFTQFNQEGIHGGYEIHNVNFSGKNGMINHIAGSFTQLLNATAGWNDSLSFTDLLGGSNADPVIPPNGNIRQNMNMASSPLIPKFYSPVNNSSSGGCSVASQAPCSIPSLLSSHHSSSQIPHYEFPIAFYDLNSPPRPEVAATSELTTAFQFPPLTPDKLTICERNQGSTTINPLLDIGSSEGRSEHCDLLVPTECSDEIVHSIFDSSSVVIASTDEPKETQVGVFEGIDLNKTPVQKPPKRRKHRPKVILEGKPKRTPKAAATKVSDSNGTPTVKRKYVRRKGPTESATEFEVSTGEATCPTAGNTEVPAKNITDFDKAIDKRNYVHKEQQESGIHIYSGETTHLYVENTEAATCTTPPTGKRQYMHEMGLKESDHPDSVRGGTLSGPRAPRKSCRRALNFDLQNTKDDGKMVAQQKILDKAFNLSTTAQATENSNLANMISVMRSVMQSSQQNRSQEENRQSGAISIHTSSRNDTIDNVLKRSAAEIQLNPAKMQRTDSRIAQHIHAEGIGQIFIPAKSNNETLQRAMMSQNNPPSSAYSIEDQGYNRDHFHAEQTGKPMANLVHSSFLSQERFQTDDCHQNTKGDLHKKRKESGMQMNTYGNTNDVRSKGFSSVRNYGTMHLHSQSNIVNRRTSKFTNDQYIRMMAGNNLSNEQNFSGSHSFAERMADANGFCSNPVSTNTAQNCNLLPQIPPSRTRWIQADQLRQRTCNPDALRNEKLMKSSLHKSGSSGKGGLLQEQLSLKDHKQQSAKRKEGSSGQRSFITVEEITNQLELLNLNVQCNEIKGNEQNALVPYMGDGAVVPYSGFDVIKKHKPRPKVDLDAETERVWKLLMWKEGSEGLEGTDQEKEKWWEEERRVFRGRADSFIARMHLVQGDRRFSKWKGSVVDSVIGVFLTQNVSDHLSSSAFMSLAARFPLKSFSNKTSHSNEIVLIEEPDCILNSNTHIQWHEKLSSTMTEHQRDCRISQIERAKKAEVCNYNLEEEVLSSQDSISSSIIQANGVGSSSGSNSEAEDPATGCKPSSRHDSSFTNLPQMERTSFAPECYSHISGNSLFHRGDMHRHAQTEDLENGQQSQRLERFNSMKGSSMLNQLSNRINPPMHALAVPSHNYWLHGTPQAEVQIEGFESYPADVSCWSSTATRFGKEKDASCRSKRDEQWVDILGKTRSQQYGSLRFQETPVAAPSYLPSKQSLSGKDNLQRYNETQQDKMNGTFQLESTTVVKPASLADSPAKNQNSYMQQMSSIPKSTREVFDIERIAVADKSTLQNSEWQLNSPNNANTETNKIALNRRKRKPQSNKNTAIDWDSLRQQVDPNGGKKERNRDTMDSLDYEAIRCANVNEISETIKERGMNNMLAERIKDFLNRLVREHGSIDLEWLRDVPPEKAKEYLLSIRGLGLKSVECVRLLTLHHLAFPVDTNVGRIAVRLGWVPLQPLPESLQLHLLELYPILETIQKYLWPRLCKLDQRTLYELHYQLITFGKVFCTKSKPNCNACPMRAECRHFASAFASARLALPGPEEKGIIPSTVPSKAERNFGVVINPTALPMLEETKLQISRPNIDSCIPIVEEPASPVQEHTEVAESDIEDILDEDPDEIPTIKLNLAELTENLQNYVQTNMELQEGDMSRALVVLNPGAASIPTPKLKNISRLRTEHQVYELPDSHPLLKEMDRREPDDPSPYLLAIWTPGETENSIQPPEQRCQYQELNKLCNEKTCFSCNSIREANSQTVRGTLLVPCRTAMRGSFPLNGTYFQVNEVFADHESSINPIHVPRAWIWNLPRRMVYFGTSVTSIFRGLSTEGIQYCFWKGFVCVRGFDQKTRAPRPLIARLHFPASRLAKTKNENR